MFKKKKKFNDNLNDEIKTNPHGILLKLSFQPIVKINMAPQKF